MDHPGRRSGRARFTVSREEMTSLSLGDRRCVGVPEEVCPRLCPVPVDHSGRRSGRARFTVSREEMTSLSLGDRRCVGVPEEVCPRLCPVPVDHSGSSQVEGTAKVHACPRRRVVLRVQPAWRSLWKTASWDSLGSEQYLSVPELGLVRPRAFHLPTVRRPPSAGGLVTLGSVPSTVRVLSAVTRPSVCMGTPLCPARQRTPPADKTCLTET
ncbi:uncharacterized protein [Saccopteryx bilineata]|uniref:uncharacterized protein isoform X2 n=1 Tax=Saccopteryx bilineata TaxID=59482 RepID=UPI0033903C68